MGGSEVSTYIGGVVSVLLGNRYIKKRKVTHIHTDPQPIMLKELLHKRPPLLGGRRSHEMPHGVQGKVCSQATPLVRARVLRDLHHGLHDSTLERGFAKRAETHVSPRATVGIFLQLLLNGDLRGGSIVQPYHHGLNMSRKFFIENSPHSGTRPFLQY